MLRVQTIVAIIVAIPLTSFPMRPAAGGGVAGDCNRNGIPDLEEIAAGAGDCDGDGLLDACELGAEASCSDPTHCVIDGVPTTALGDATLAIVEVAPWRALAVDGLGGAGESGIAQDLAAAGEAREAGLAFLPPNLGAAPNDAALELSVARGPRGDPAEPPLRLSIRSFGFGLLYEPDLAQLAPPPYEIRVYRGSAVVAVERDLAAPRFASSPADLAAVTFRQRDECLAGGELPRPCTAEVPCPGDCRTVLAVSVRLAAPAIINVPGRGEVDGDEIEIVPQLAALDPVPFVRLELRGRFLERLLIPLGEIPGEEPRDCDQNGVPDLCEIRDGLAADCDGNAVPDACQLDPATDCDGNGALDACEIAAGLVADCNGNGVPDACETGGPVDCDGNGVPDACEIRDGLVADCDGNGVPDACDIAHEAAADCNANGVPDSCDIASGASDDADGDGIPDDCAAAGPTPRELFDEALAAAERLRADGFLPEETIEFLLANEALFASDPDALAEAVFAVEVGEAPAGLRLGAGAGAASGNVDGVNWVLWNNRRIPVGIMRPVIRWNNHADPCTSAIVEHFFMGGVINGVCRTEQVSAITLDGCPPTGTCTIPVRECAEVRVVCTQTIGLRTTTIFTPPAYLCAQCAEFPGGQIPGDCNSDGRVDIADPSCVFGFLFLGSPAALPCGDGTSTYSANLALLDWNGDLTLDLSDGIGTLNWLFNGGPGAPGHVLGKTCRQLSGCVENCNP